MQGTITADFTTGRLTGDLVKENILTVWIRLPNGRVIKRHRRKHHCEWI